jgi:hypothetical protein
VESDIVGRDNDAELIGTPVVAALDLLVARRVACAVGGSALDFGDVENS